MKRYEIMADHTEGILDMVGFERLCDIKRYNIFGLDCDGCEEDPQTVSCHDGQWCDAEEALAEIAKRDAEIQALHEENARLEGALRALVSEIERDSATRFYVGRSDCPKCEPHPDKPSAICPYHKAKALLDGEP